MYIRYSNELQLLHTKWKPGHSLHHLRLALSRVLDMAQQHAVKRIVLDMHHMTDIDVMDQAWVSLYWFPKMAALSLQQVAVVVPAQSLYNQMVVENILWVGQALIQFDVQYFSDLPAALDWVAQDTTILSMLD